MRILIVTDTYHPHVNGSSSFNQRLAKGLLTMGHDVLVIAPSETFRMEERIHDGVRIFGVRSLPILSYGYRYAPRLFSKRALTKVIDDFKPDVIHFNSHFSPNTTVLSIAKKRCIPFFASNHFIPDNLLPYLHVPSFLLPLARKLFWWPFRHVYEEFDCVCTPTKSAANYIRPHARFKRLVWNSNGIDTKRFHPTNDPSHIRETLLLDTTRPSLLFVGRLDREKHVSVILRAMSRLPNEIPCQLLIAGRGSDEPALHALTNELFLNDRVRFLGFVSDDDLPFLYAHATAFVIASLAELQSIATLEAMATGKPVIGANALALPELIQDGVNGYLYPPDDEKALAEGIQKLLSDPQKREDMGKKSRMIAESHDIKESLKRFVSFYQELTSTPSQSS